MPALDPTLPTPRLNVATPASPANARVTKVERCAAAESPAAFFHVEIDVGGTPMEGAFLPGQSFGVIPPASSDQPGAPGKPVLRIYSIASPAAGEDGAGRVISATVRVVQGAAGAATHLTGLEPGASVRITGPVGRNFLLPADPSLHDYVFIASGTGVAPFRGMALELAARAPGSSATLIVAAPNKDELLYDGFFAGRASGGARLRYTPAVARTATSEAFASAVGDAIDSARDALANPRTLFYICGPEAIEQAARAALARMGVAETFFAMASDAAGGTGVAARPTKRCMVVTY